MGVQGFPTLKIVRPGKKPGRPLVDDYQGERTAKAIVDGVKEKIPNHVKRVTDKVLDEWLQEGNDTAKTILFSNKGTTGALLKALAIDFLGSVSVAQIRDKEKAAVEMFGITTYPTFVLLPGGAQESLVYIGDMNKANMTAFLSKVASPNPEPTSKAKSKKPKASSKVSKKASKASSEFASASASHESAESVGSKAATQTMESMEGEATESPNPNVVGEDTQTPIAVPVPEERMIKALDTAEDLQQACLTTKSGLCLLVLFGHGHTPERELSISDLGPPRPLVTLSNIHHKHTHGGGKLFPVYAVPGDNPASSNLRSLLGLDSDSMFNIVVVNGKRGWFKKFTGNTFSPEDIETWIDEIRMGEGKKESMPESVLVEPSEEHVVRGRDIPLDPGSRLSTEEIERMIKEAEEYAQADENAQASRGDDQQFEVQMEELTDEEVEKLLKQARERGKPVTPEHGEL